MGGYRDVDAGQGALLLDIVVLVGYLMERSIRVHEPSATEGDSRVSGCSLNHVSSCMWLFVVFIFVDILNF